MRNWEIKINQKGRIVNPIITEKNGRREKHTVKRDALVSTLIRHACEETTYGSPIVKIYRSTGTVQTLRPTTKKLENDDYRRRFLRMTKRLRNATVFIERD